MSRFGLKSHDYLTSPERKRLFNERLFSAIAEEYGRMTRMLSFGSDARWKRQLIEQLPRMQEPKCLELACGNGDITALLLERYPKAHIEGLDIAEPMLDIARSRMPAEADVSFSKGDIMATGFPDASFDVVTVGYGLRNAPALAAAMAEITRVLKSGGMLATLDFSKYNNRVAAGVELTLLKLWCGLWGLLRSGNPDTYAYIGHSLAQFPSRNQIHTLFSENDVTIVRSFLHFGGVTETIIAVKDGQE